MKAEIDQSGKIEQLNTHTVVALSNDIKSAVYISSKEKIKLYKTLRGTVIRRRDQNAIIFAVLVFTLLKHSNKKNGTVIIDIEYSGKNDLIENTINKIKNSKIPDINFKMVGKSSKAHAHGISIYRKKDKKKCKVLMASDILGYLRL